MRVAMGSDHAGYHLKAGLPARLTKQGYAVVDHGPHSWLASGFRKSH